MTTEATDRLENIASPLLSGRRILWVGCALILAVMCISTADIIYSLRKAAARSDAVTALSRQRSHLLDRIRGLMLRSALSPENRGQRGLDASELPAAHLQAGELLDEYGRSLDEGGAEATQQKLADLKNAIDQYWASLPAMRALNEEHPDATQPLPGSQERIQIRHIVRQITALNNEQADRAQTELHAEQIHLQNEILVSSLLSLGVVFGLIAAISYRIRYTERYAATQYQQVVEARSELRKFTAQLENAQEEERRKLSRELHDELGQTMAAALVELSRIQSEMIHDGPTKAQLAGVKLELENSMRSIRDIALLLRPSMLDDLGLVPALRWQGREIARRTGLAVSVEADDNNEFLPDSYRTCIYRVVQEALHNAVKHASATSVIVVFKSVDEVLNLTISDNGKGFNPVIEKGMGLLGIEERVARLSGYARFTSSPGKGSRIHVTLPIPATTEREMQA